MRARVMRSPILALLLCFLLVNAEAQTQAPRARNSRADAQRAHATACATFNPHPGQPGDSSFAQSVRRLRPQPGA